MSKASLRIRTCLLAPAIALALSAGSCQQKPAEDPNTPTVYMLHFEKNEAGGQANQVRTDSGGTIQVDRDFLGYSKADIRIYGKEKPGPGIEKLVVTGYGNGKCQTEEEGGVFYTTPDSTTKVTVPTQTESAPSGSVKNPLVVDLDDVLHDLSCGIKTYGDDPPREYFLRSGVLYLTAKATNCCGGAVDAKFTIKVE